MANTQSYVSTGKPQVTGGLWRAPKGTAAPTNATSALSNSFACLGYLSDDGLSNNRSVSTEAIKAWGGSIVLRAQTEFSDEFGFTLIESGNPEALKMTFGDDNVTTGTGGTISVKVNEKEVDECVLVAEIALSNGNLRRIVIPHAKPTEFEEIVYNDSDPIGYGMTVGALPDSSGNTHYEYTAAPTTSGGSGA